MLESGANVSAVLDEGGSLFLLDVVRIGLPIARRISTMASRDPASVEHIRLGELEHLARVFGFTESHLWLRSWLEDAILQRFRTVEVLPVDDRHYRYRFGDSDAEGRGGGNSIDDVRRHVRAALADPDWSGELRILVDEPERLVIEFAHIGE